MAAGGAAGGDHGGTCGGCLAQLRSALISVECTMGAPQ